MLAKKDRIGKSTELETAVFAGKLGEKAIKSIELAKQYLDNDWYEKMQKIITANKDKELDYNLPEKGVITGELQDSDELQAIIAKDWNKLAKIKEEKRKQQQKQ